MRNRLGKIRYLSKFMIALMIIMKLTVVAHATELYVHVLDVGEGLSILLQSEDAYMLYDGGGREASSKVVSYLQKHEVTTLDYLIASHYDEDHIAGLIGAIHTTDTQTVIGPNYSVESEIYKSFVNALQNKSLPIVTPAAGSSFQFGDATCTILSSPCNWHEDKNDNSIVLKIKCGNNSVILAGDATSVVEQEMITSGRDLAADVLVAGHHGSNTSTSEAFLTAVNPSVVVLSCSTDNSYGHPAGEVMNRLENHAIPVLRTDYQGDLTLFSDGEIWNFEPLPIADYSSGIFADDNLSKSVPSELIDDTGSNTDNIAESDNGNSEIITVEYILNMNTKKFHYPTCRSVKDIKEENYGESNLSRDELIAQGYSPCGNCKP